MFLKLASTFHTPTITSVRETTQSHCPWWISDDYKCLVYYVLGPWTPGQVPCFQKLYDEFNSKQRLTYSWLYKIQRLEKFSFQVLLLLLLLLLLLCAWVLACTCTHMRMHVHVRFPIRHFHHIHPSMVATGITIFLLVILYLVCFAKGWWPSWENTMIYSTE